VLAQAERWPGPAWFRSSGCLRRRRSRNSPREKGRCSLASSQLIHLPLCQIFSVAWIGIDAPCSLEPLAWCRSNLQNTVREAKRQCAARSGNAAIATNLARTVILARGSDGLPLVAGFPGEPAAPALGADAGEFIEGMPTWLRGGCDPSCSPQRPRVQMGIAVAATSSFCPPRSPGFRLPPKELGRTGKT